MSSSFSNDPAPNDPRHEDGYTPTPPTPKSQPKIERGEDEPGVPRLGSLAQKARGNRLKQARVIFLFVGVATILINILDISQIRSQFQQAVEKQIQKQGGPGMVRIDRALLQKEEDNAFLIGSLIDGLFILSGFIFLLLGVLVYRFPVPATVIGLVLYIVAFVAGLTITIAFGEGETIARYATGGAIVRIAIVIGLISSIKSALVYESERRAEAEFEPAT